MKAGDAHRRSAESWLAAAERHDELALSAATSALANSDKVICELDVRLADAYSKLASAEAAVGMLGMECGKRHDEIEAANVEPE